MYLVFSFPQTSRSQVDAIVNEEPIVRQSIITRSADNVNSKRDGMIVFIEGSEDACKAAKEKLKDFEEVTGEEKDNIIKKIKEDEDKSIEGFGNIF